MRVPSYHILAINILSAMLDYVYGPNHKLTSHQNLGVMVAT